MNSSIAEKTDLQHTHTITYQLNIYTISMNNSTISRAYIPRILICHIATSLHTHFVHVMHAPTEADNDRIKCSLKSFDTCGRYEIIQLVAFDKSQMEHSADI